MFALDNPVIKKYILCRNDHANCNVRLIPNLMRSLRTTIVELYASCVGPNGKVTAITLLDIKGIQFLSEIRLLD